VVRGGHDAEVHAHRAGRADRDDLLLLEHAEERRLRRERQISDLVEEERAAARRADEPFGVPVGARERTAHVPEELSFDERRGERTAVDRDERPAPPRRGVDGASQHLLPRAGLAQQEHRQDRTGDAFHVAERGSERRQQGREAIGPVRRGVEIGRVVGHEDPLPEDECGPSDLDDVSVGEERAAERGALEARPVRRARVLDDPPVAGPRELRVRGGEPPIGDAHVENAHAPLHLAYRAPLGPPADEHLVDPVERVASPARCEALPLEHEEQRGGVRAGRGAHGRRGGVFERVVLRDHGAPRLPRAWAASPSTARPPVSPTQRGVSRGSARRRGSRAFAGLRSRHVRCTPAAA
jgi:hypothetical protein